MKKLTNAEIREVATDMEAGMVVYANIKTGEIFSTPDFEGNPYAEEEGWEDIIETIETEAAADNLFCFEKMTSFQAFKLMESFTETVQDAKIKERLFYALNKNKPFKNFKYELEYHNEVLNDWYKYKTLQYEYWVREQIGQEIAETEIESNTPEPTLNPNRTNISSGAKWEDIVGYSRAVRIGNIIEVAGTTAVDENGNIVGQNDVYTQTKFIFQKIEAALQEAGAKLSDVVRTRMFVTNIQDWEAVGKAHGEFFKNIKPASTMLEISGLINPDMLIEIEVTAIL